MFLLVLARVAIKIDALNFAIRLKSWVDSALMCLDRLPLGSGKTAESIVKDKELQKLFGVFVRCVYCSVAHLFD